MSRLQRWMEDNMPSSEMLYKDAFVHQVCFVRDRLSSILSRTYAEYRDLWDIASTHRSKSILLPVYHSTFSDGLLTAQLWMRNNFYNWNVSVEANFPFGRNQFYGCVDDSGSYTYCEGMEQWRFSTMADDSYRFTVAIHNDYDLYCFCRVLKFVLDIKPTD